MKYIIDRRAWLDVAPKVIRKGLGGLMPLGTRGTYQADVTLLGAVAGGPWDAAGRGHEASRHQPMAQLRADSSTHDGRRTISAVEIVALAHSSARPA